MADLEKKVSTEEEALRKRLRDLQEQRAKRDEAKRLEELRKEIEEEEYEAEEEALEAECAQHERFGGRGERGVDFDILRYGERLVAFHRPEQNVHRDFMTRVNRAVMKDKAPEPADANNFVIKCLLKPTPEEFGAIAEKYPGAPGEISNKLLDLAKGAAKRRAKK